MWKLNVKVIKIGTCTIDPGNMASTTYMMFKNQMGIGGGSTVTVIKEKDELLLIDTGYDQESDLSQQNGDKNWNLLRSLLQLNDIDPANITKVFITHFHRDHYGGIERFENARWYCHRFALDHFDSPLKGKFIPLDDGYHIIPNTIVITTPGHTQVHSSIVWTNENKTVRAAICGDAIINLSWLQSKYIWKFNSDFFDVKIAKQSIMSLLNESDIIIPGHGQPFFMTKRLKTIYD
jgi:glyoxylase-like metal-dependent hydrolase (beta-lactamase superfamily II)